MKSRKLLMIPGPIEFTPEVLSAMGLPTTSHVASNFIEVFGEALERLRQVFVSPAGQPFVVAGSGTLAMDMAVANTMEPGDRALVVNTGYFSDRFAAILKRYGATITDARASEVGDAPSFQTVEEHLKTAAYKLMTITHVDTSTGVRADVARLAALARQYGTMVFVDGVCSVGGEELRQDDWGVDLALTASQKAIGVPPGLALVVVGPRAMEAFRTRTRPVLNYYADWNEWLPIMEAYEARNPSYFGTPPVNLIWALNVSLGQILAEGMDVRFARHQKLAGAFRAAAEALGLRSVPVSRALTANTLSALYYPEALDAKLVGFMGEGGVIVAGGLHPEIKAKYFRVGHMGAVTPADILATVGALEGSLLRAGVNITPGVGLAAAMGVLAQTGGS
jgi:alanine-glyoxylate transaminase/serine-glyoxylate transaminase/serine-pyruvate transaminase